MAVTDPIAWTQVEDALWYWISQCTGVPADRVRVQIPRDDGEARGPAPKATLELISFVPTSKTMIAPIPSIMEQRYTVIANGPGEVGVDFYPDVSLVPQRISIVAGVGDPPATSAAALLLQLQADLPAGYTAIADPEDPASVLVSGSVDEPLFAALPADALLLSVFTTMSRFPDLLKVQAAIVWRVSFRANDVSGLGLAANAMAKAVTFREELLDPRMRRLGFFSAGTPLSEPTVPTDRSESLAVLDVRFIGHCTGAVARTVMRALGFTQTAAAA